MSNPSVARRPWWLGFAVILVGGVWSYGAWKLPIADRLSGIGPGAFALFVGLALMLLGVILLFQILRGETFEAADSEDALADAPASVPALAMILVAVFSPALLMPVTGFPLSGAVSYTLVTRALGSRNLVLNFIIGAVLASGCWYAFSKLGVQLGSFLPTGF